MRFHNQVVLVTASSTGIGLAISEQFAKEGATVIITSRNKKNVDDAVLKIKNQGGKAEGLVTHAGKQDDIKQTIKFIKEKYGRLDVLVPNAAVSTHVGQTLDMSLAQFDKLFEVNFRGVFILIKESIELLESTPNSSIIIISSIQGYSLESGIGMYGVTKTALISLTKLLSKELKVRVNCCAPGIIKTKFSSLLWEGKETEVAQQNQVSRLGEVEDVAKVVAFLASKDASYINGETIVVAGKTSPRL